MKVSPMILRFTSGLTVTHSGSEVSPSILVVAWNGGERTRERENERTSENEREEGREGERKSEREKKRESKAGTRLRRRETKKE